MDGHQRAPALLLLGLDYREPGWVFKCFKLSKYLTETTQKTTDKDLDSDQKLDSDKDDKETSPDHNNNNNNNNKSNNKSNNKRNKKVLEWSGASNALQRKLSRVVNKVLAGDMEYTNKVMMVVWWMSTCPLTRNMLCLLPTLS